MGRYKFISDKRMKRVHSSPPGEVIDLTDDVESPPALKVAKTAPPHPRQAAAARPRTQPAPTNLAHRRNFHSQRPTSAASGQNRSENLWGSFPGPDVFSHPSERFRGFLNPDPDYFTAVAEELARSLPLSKPGDSKTPWSQRRKKIYRYWTVLYLCDFLVMKVI